MINAATLIRRLAVISEDDGERELLASLLGRPGSLQAVADALALASRDRLLYQAWLDHYIHLAPTAAARGVAVDLQRYQSSAWRYDQNKSLCPYAAGTKNAAFWGILSLNSRALQPRQIKTILSAQMQFGLHSDPSIIDGSKEGEQGAKK
jgi:hypothetical protein